MKCPKCGNNVLNTDDFCSNCKMNLSFTTRTKSSYKKINQTFEEMGKKTNNLKGKIILIAFVAVMLLMVFVSFDNIFLIFKVLAFIQKYSKMIILIGIGLLFLWLILFFTKKKIKIMKVIFAVSLIFIVAPTVLSSMIQIENDLSFFLKDYSMVNYIEIGTEKIPTIYSVLGYRKIITNIEGKDEYDEKMKTKIDFISIIYKGLSNEDINLYKNKILEIGYEEKNIIDDEETVTFYTKDKNDNTFYVISIVDNNITYSNGNGSFDDVLNNK